jgi:hypothetical protein
MTAARLRCRQLGKSPHALTMCVRMRTNRDAVRASRRRRAQLCSYRQRRRSTIIDDPQSSSGPRRLTWKVTRPLKLPVRRAIALLLRCCRRLLLQPSHDTRQMLAFVLATTPLALGECDSLLIDALVKEARAHGEELGYRLEAPGYSSFCIAATTAGFIRIFLVLHRGDHGQVSSDLDHPRVAARTGNPEGRPPARRGWPWNRLGLGRWGFFLIALAVLSSLGHLA